MKNKRNTNLITNTTHPMAKKARLAARRTSKRRGCRGIDALAKGLKQTIRRRRLRLERRRLTPLQHTAKLRRLDRERRAARLRAASLRQKRLARKKRIAAKRPKHYSYIDCLRDEVPEPTGNDGTTLYQTLMVGGMTAVTFTASGVYSDGVSFLIYNHWLYPMMFSISFLVRIYIGGPLTRILGRRLIDGRLQGAGRNMANVALGTAVLSPVTGAITTLLFAKADSPDDYADAYLETLSTTMPISVLASLFVVGPLTKLIFNNRVKPADGLRVLKALSDHACSFARVFGF